MLQYGDVAIAKDLLTTPEHASARHYYRQVFELDPDNSFAARGLQRIAARYGELALLVMEKKQYDKADVYIRRGLSVASKDSELLALQTELEARREAEKSAMIAQLSEVELEPEPEPTSVFGALKRFFGSE